MRKQLDLILTALLPAMVLIVSFFAVSSKAGLKRDISPEGATPFYMDEDNNFGPEIKSDNLCPPVDPDEGFDIYQTSETATVSDTSIEDEIRWYRFQRWDFTSDNTPWGTNYAEATTSGLLTVVDENEVSRGTSGTGFPWSGYEIHSRTSQYQYVTTTADLTGWRYYQHDANEIKYICPNYYKFSSNYRYYCKTGSVDPGLGYKEVYNHRKKGKDYFFSDPDFPDEEQLILGREVLRKVGDNGSSQTGDWHYCIEVN